jgi:prepilin-type N-terminal cleavage/methylation domain-containing protein
MASVHKHSLFTNEENPMDKEGEGDSLLFFVKQNMFKKKKGFSLIELIIVMVVVGILFVALRSSFQVKNKEVFYGQACVESIYGQVNNFLYSAISSKAINS